MEDLNNDCANESPQCFYSFTTVCSNTNGENGFSNWTTLYGGPWWMDASTNCQTTLYNQNFLPGDPGGQIGLRNIWNSNNLPEGPAFITDVAVDANTNYILSFFRTNLDPTIPSTGYEVALTDTADITWTGGNVGNLPTLFPITEEFAFNGVDWRQRVTCFSTDNDPSYNALFVEGKSSQSGLILGTIFDNMELIEDNMPGMPQSFTVDCNTPTDIGVELCTVSNMEYQWWDVTTAGVAIQLTAGTTILPTLVPYSVSGVNGSGSVIEISGLTEDRQMELRRVFPNQGAFGIPIDHNCNAVVAVDVVLDCPQNNCILQSWPKNYSSLDPVFAEATLSLAVNNNGEVYTYGRVDNTVAFENWTLIPGHNFLAKYENCGDLIWVKDVSAYGDDLLNEGEIKLDNQGNIVMLTGFGNHLVQHTEHRLTKFAPNGQELWSNAIEQAYVLPFPSFDVDQNTGDIYLVASVGSYLRIKDQSNSYIVDASFSQGITFGRQMSYLVKFDPQGFELWQDRLMALGGVGSFRDVLVGESIGRVYVAGVQRHHTTSNSVVYLQSNPMNQLAPSANSRMFIASYSVNGQVNTFQTYSSIHGTDWMDMEFSNSDNQLYIKSLDKLYLFNANASLLGNTTINFSDFDIEYDQNDNALLLSGFAANAAYKPCIAKYNGLNQTWYYQVNNLSKGIIRASCPDPTSDKIFIAGSYFDNDLIFSPSSIGPNTVLPFGGGTDAFVTRLYDQGNSATYKSEKPGETAEQSAETGLPLSMSVHPNPTQSVVEVRMEGERPDLGDLQLFNSTGVLLISKSFNLERGNVLFDLSEFPAGVYFLRFSDPAGNYQVEQILKN